MHDLIDIGANLTHDSFDKDRDRVIQRAAFSGISRMIVTGASKEGSTQAYRLSKKYPEVLYATAGVHPHHAADYDDETDNLLRELNKEPTVVAVGECGLDFRPQQADKRTQLHFFETQLNIAADARLPVVIHSVRATETVIQLIKKFKTPGGMIHSFSGSTEQARQLIDLNFYISLGGSVTYDNAKKIRKVAKEIPLTSLLLETDAPDQPDQKNQGKRNEPAYLVNTLEVISELREESAEAIATQTTTNAKTLFNIP